MKQKHIDGAREARLWIRDIFVPIGGLIIAYMHSPAYKNKVKGDNKFYTIK